MGQGCRRLKDRLRHALVWWIDERKERDNDQRWIRQRRRLSERSGLRGDSFTAEVDIRRRSLQILPTTAALCVARSAYPYAITFLRF